MPKKLDFALFLYKKYDIPLENFDFFQKKRRFSLILCEKCNITPKKWIFRLFLGGKCDIKPKKPVFPLFLCEKCNIIPKKTQFFPKNGVLHLFYV